MEYYNISRRGGWQPLPPEQLLPPLGAAGEKPALPPGLPRGRARFGAASMFLHTIALAALTALVSTPLPPPPLDERAIEMVFEQPEEPPPPEPIAESPPEPPTPAPPPPQEPPPPLPPEEQPPPPQPAPPPMSETPPPRLEPPLVPRPPKPKPLPSLKPPPPKPDVAVQAPAKIPAPRQAEQSNPVPVARAAPAPITAPPGPTTAQVVDPSWQTSVSGWLTSRKSYPDEARRRGEEGRVVMRFTIDRSGRVLEANVVSGSGSQLLDAATIALLRNASLPAFPSSMPQARITITTSVRYSLR